MSKKLPLKIEMQEEELASVISSLLFSCSVSVVSNTNEEYQTELFNLAKSLKQIKPDIKLDNIQFLKEDYYEDLISSEVFKEFKDNMEITTFEHV